MRKLIIKYLYPIMVLPSIYNIFQSLDQTFRKLYSSLAFCNCSILVFVRLSVTLFRFLSIFFLLLKIFTRGLFLSGFWSLKRCVLSISLCVIFSSIFFKISIATSSVFSWFSSSMLCISKEFLLEYCSW